VDKQADSGRPAGDEQQPTLDVDEAARRRLLKIIAYTAPAVVGTLLVSKDASAQPSSCPPNAGCQPNCGPASCKPHP
jgi:hypothetical protein